MRTLLAVALGMLLASAALAEPPEKINEFYLGLGDASLVFELDEIFSLVLSMGTVTYSDPEGAIQIFGGYQRRLGRWASAGVSASWVSGSRRMYILGTEVGEVDRRVFTLMADGRAHWLTRRSVDLYSGIALGYVNWTDDWEHHSADDETETGLGFLLTALGVRYGRDVGAYLELGGGWSSVLRGGISARF